MDGTTTMQGTEQEVQNTATETQGQQTAESTPEKVLVNETAHMDREPAAIHIVGFFAEQVEKLGITHGNKEVEAIVSITHDEEQGSFPVSQSVQL